MRHHPAAPLALALACLLVAGCGGGGSGGGDPARDAATRFAAAWSGGDDRGAAALTTRPAAARAALSASRAGLDGARVGVGIAALSTDGDRARGTLSVAWRVPAIGRFAYRAPITLVHSGDAWNVVWTPRTLHPALRSTTRLGTVDDRPARAAIVDRNDRDIVALSEVVRIGLQRDKVPSGELTQTARTVARALDVDADAYVKAVRGAGPKQFVEAITLRRADAAEVVPKVADIPGVLRVDDNEPLTPTRAYARALVGAVGPATAEQVKASRGRIAAGAAVGQWGLEQQFDSQLAGRGGARVVVRAVSDGRVVRTLLRRRGVAPKPLQTTLSDRAQRAAESALGDTSGNAALVAVQPSSGDALAVANRPTDSTFDRALAGSYPPGSTFKVVSTAALLRAGLKPDASVACPQTLTVDGKSFRNFEGESGAGASFARDFAISCNTAFVSLAPRLSSGALTDVARDFGLGRRLELGVGTARSAVPAPRTQVERAASMIGQERIVASPLAMAGVAATVAEGRWRSPRLLESDPSQSGPELPAGERETLRTLMRGVVTGGSGTALAGVPGDVAGKTGTAEYGGGDPPPTHAWFICFRGDLALAVLVEKGRSGASAAAPLAARFFSAYDAAG